MNINEQIVLEAIKNTDRDKLKDKPDVLMFLDLLEIGVENIVWSDYPTKTQETLKDMLVKLLKND